MNSHGGVLSWTDWPWLANQGQSPELSREPSWEVWHAWPWLARAASLVATIFVVTGVRADEPSADATMERGLAQFRAGQFSSAAKSYDEALGGEPNSSYSMGFKKPERHTALALVGRALANAKAHPRELQPMTDAAFDYQAALKLDPQVAASYARWAGAPGEAEVRDLQSLTQRFTAATASFVGGQAAMANGALQDAFAAYTKSLELYPCEMDVLVSRLYVQPVRRIHQGARRPVRSDSFRREWERTGRPL